MWRVVRAKRVKRSRRRAFCKLPYSIAVCLLLPKRQEMLTSYSYAPGDFTTPTLSNITSYSTGNFTLPQDIRTNNSVYVFQENQEPALLDLLVGNKSVDGHDWRSNFSWIMEQGFDWVITDTPDFWATELESQGKRNMGRLLKEGATWRDGRANQWYRRHARDVTRGQEM